MTKPGIRLKGYNGSWSKTPLSEIASFSKGRGYSKMDLKSKGSPIILYGRLYTNYETVINEVDTYVNKQQNSVVSKGGEIIIPASGETPEDIACASVVGSSDIILGGDLNVLSIKSDLYDKAFTALAISYGSVHNELAKSAQGKTVVHLHNSEISKTQIFYPNDVLEQKAIVKYFKSLDSMIQATMKKIASLKQMKSASLVAMFPQTGETKPRVRFKGFDANWEEKQLNECLDISTERNTDDKYGKEDVLSVSDDFGVVNQIDLLGRSYAGKSVSNYGILKQGQLVYTKSPLKSKPYGIIKENTGNTGIVSVLYAIYTAKDNTWIPFIHYYFDPAWRLNAYLRPLINKGAKNTMNISDEMALTGYIMIPKDIKEQQKIASYFKSLDKQISLQEQRLEKLKQIKAACLDKMFV